MPESFVPILFKVLFGFICLNIVINLILLHIGRRSLNKLLALYWPAVLVVFILQAWLQEGPLAITFAGSMSIIAMLIFAKIGFQVVGRKFPLRNYIIYHTLAYPLTYYLYTLGVDFKILALPVSITNATPLIHAFIYIMFVDRKRSTRLQQVLAGMYVLMAIQCLNFALFRMEPNAQLWGWLVTYALYDTLAILLPSIALEQANMNENERLQGLVKEKTFSLNTSLKENENLVKILIHDISNPMTVMKWYLQVMNPSDDETNALLTKVRKSQDAIEGILKQVKDLHNKKVPNKTAVSLEECFEDVSFIFAQVLESKHILLKFTNNLPPGTKIMADKTSFTHSVLSNLVSNSLKFSQPFSIIEVIASGDEKNVILEVKDRGPGISKEVINNLMNNELVASTRGTAGEVGSGFGLSIVKSYVESFGGQIEFESKVAFTNPEDHGTNVRITLNRAHEGSPEGARLP